MIRRAKMDDLNDLMVYAREFMEYYPAKLKWNPKHIRGVLYDMIANHVVLVAVEGKVVKGAIGGRVCANLFDPDEVHLTELFWWVGKEWRNGKLGMELFKAFEQVASILKVTSVVMTTTSLTPVLNKLYQRRGYENYENTYMRRV